MMSAVESKSEDDDDESWVDVVVENKNEMEF
jgi:hypothetical protein